jgi:signal transduction histidine kinase
LSVAPASDLSVARATDDTKLSTAYGWRVHERLTPFLFRHADYVLAAAMTTIALMQIAAADEPLWVRLLGAATFLVLGLATALRGKYPLALLALLITALVVGSLLPGHFDDIEAIGFFIVLAIYTAAARTGGRRTVVAGGLTIVIWVSGLVGDPEEINLGGVLFFTLLFGSPWVAGRVIRRRRLNETRLEREKEEAQAAIAEERTRIARELHDVVAHAISVIVLQARGGRKLLDDEPEETRQALDAIERTASQALGEMRRLLGLLRENGEDLTLVPQPSIAHLDRLTSQVSAAGLPVELSIEGAPVELPPGVDLSAYRILQEALTNALKHAGPATARVTVRYGADELDLEVSDDGRGSTNGGAPGHGLTGIRERVAVFGGDVEAGARTDGGFAVRARLPYSTTR